MRWFDVFRLFTPRRPTPARPERQLPPEVDHRGQRVHCDLSMSQDPERFPSLAGVLSTPERRRFVPAAVLAQKAKSVCDGTIAALEGLSTRGDELGMGVREFLGQLSAQLDGGSEARDLVDAAIDLADGVEPPRGRAKGFLDMNPAKAKVLGFYTWTEELRRVFRRDRLLQEELTETEAQSLAAAIARDPRLSSTYGRHIVRIARLTNRLSRPSLAYRIAHGRRDPEPRAEAVFPSSDSVETTYDSIDAFLTSVATGACDLTPRPGDGFYAHQLHTLTPLLRPDSMPEARCRSAGADYVAALRSFAAATLFAARESHVKQLEIGAPVMGAPVRCVRPGLTIEPLPSFYERTADAFRFLRPVVERGWGPKALDAPQLRRGGALAASVGEGIDQVIALCEAARDLSWRELEGEGAGADVDAWRAQLAALTEDPDVTDDARGMVPIAFTPEGQLRVLVFAGWELHALEVQLSFLPALPPDTVLGTEWHPLPVPLVREAILAPNAMLDRDEFRAVCDRALYDPAQAPAFAKKYPKGPMMLGGKVS